MNRVYKLKAYFNEYNPNTKKCTMLFLDDEAEPFTKPFLTKYYSSAQNNPLDGQRFYVNTSLKSLCYLDKNHEHVTHIQNLVDNVCELHVKLKNYNFTQNGKKIIGWNIQLLTMIKC